MLSRYAALFFGALFIVCSFCTVLPAPANEPTPAEESIRAEEPGAVVISTGSVPGLIRVPLTRQATVYTCGVAALQSVLYHYGHEWREDQLMENLEVDPENGTLYRSMVEFVRSQGFRADVLTGMSLEYLKRSIDRKKPVIVLLQAWPDGPVDYARDWEDGHYAVAIGYDSERIYFMDPSTLGNYTYVPTGEFLKRWHDIDGVEPLHHFGMIIAPEEETHTYDPEEILRMD